MKKTLLATVLVATSATAFANPTFYVQGDLGVNAVRGDTLKAVEYVTGANKVSDNTLKGVVSAGVKVNDNIRVAADYSYYSKTDVHGHKTEYPSENIKNDFTIDYDIKQHSAGVTGFYDFKPVNKFTPYAGVRVAHNWTKTNGVVGLEATNMRTGVTATAEERLSKSYTAKNWSVGVQGGVNYTLAKNLDVNAGLEYTVHLDEQEVADDKLQEFTAKTGLRYTF